MEAFHRCTCRCSLPGSLAGWQSSHVDQSPLPPPNPFPCTCSRSSAHRKAWQPPRTAAPRTSLHSPSRTLGATCRQLALSTAQPWCDPCLSNLPVIPAFGTQTREPHASLSWKRLLISPSSTVNSVLLNLLTNLPVERETEARAVSAKLSAVQSTQNYSFEHSRRGLQDRGSQNIWVGRDFQSHPLPHAGVPSTEPFT